MLPCSPRKSRDPGPRQPGSLFGQEKQKVFVSLVETRGFGAGFLFLLTSHTLGALKFGKVFLLSFFRLKQKSLRGFLPLH